MSDAQVPQAPASVKVFGILNIVFGGLTILIYGVVGVLIGMIFGGSGLMSMGLAAAGSSGAGGAAAMVSVFMIITLLLAIFELIVGIRMVKQIPQSIKLAMYWAVASIVVTIISIIMAGRFGFIGVSGLIYPVLMLVLVVFNKQVREWVAARAGEAPGPEPATGAE